MPRGKPRKQTNLRLDPELMAEVRGYTDNLTRAIEDGLRLWLKRAKKTTKAKKPKGDASDPEDPNLRFTRRSHASGTAKPAICAGFLLRGVDHNHAVCLMLISGTLDLSTVSDGGHALHADYRAMAVANGVRADDPVLRECR